jgi:hypothetical protein
MYSHRRHFLRGFESRIDAKHGERCVGVDNFVVSDVMLRT